jgi:chromosome segregation ATPase
MFISPTNAVKMYNVSKPTLYKDMSDGTLSFDKDDRGRRKLNVAELDRLYDKREDAKTDLTSANVNSGQSLTESNVNNQQLTRQLKSIREQIENTKDREIQLLEQQIEQFKDQIENLNRHLDETREEHRGYMRLLENKSKEQGAKTSQWDEKIQLMEYELKAVKEQNQILISREEERKKRTEEKRRRRAEVKLKKEENNKSFFSKLFG